MSGMKIKVHLKPVNAVALLSRYIDDFDKKAADTHRKWVLMVDEYILKYSRLDTGRSRGAWTPFMVAQGHDFYRSMPAGGDPTAFAEGQSEGSFTDRDFHTELVNNVDYVEVMDRRYGMFGYSPSENIGFGGFATESTKQRGVRKVFAVTQFGNKITRAPSFNDKLAYFEGMASIVFEKFMENAKAAYERKRQFDPGKIPPIDVPPPMNP